MYVSVTGLKPIGLISWIRFWTLTIPASKDAKVANEILHFAFNSRNGFQRTLNVWKEKEDMLAYGKKSAAINQFPNLIFESDGDNIYMTAENTDNPSSEQHRRKIQEDVHGCFEFRVVFSVSRLKMISDDYQVDIFEPNLGRFTSENRDYTFFSALDSNVVYDNDQHTDDIDEEDDE